MIIVYFWRCTVIRFWGFCFLTQAKNLPISGSAFKASMVLIPLPNAYYQIKHESVGGKPNKYQLSNLFPDFCAWYAVWVLSDGL